MDPRFFTTNVLRWYRENKRDLPWRNTTDPYRIWLAEIIMQQTRIEQGLPYYINFLNTFPDVFQLASAPVNKILRLWQGLGYYTRARNLHACARHVVRQYNGTFPGQYEELLRLPGIGPYTAAAIASIAYRQPVAAVDGNVYRVLARHFGLELPINSPAGRKAFQELAQQLLDPHQPGEYNQAVMELGALTCTPKNPACTACPVRSGCRAFHQHLWHKLPVKAGCRKSRTRYLYYLVFTLDKKIYMRKRTGKDIWKGLYDFYCLEYYKPQQPQRIVHSLKSLHGHPAHVSPAYRHQLTHQKIVARFIKIVNPNKVPERAGLRPYSSWQAAKLPKPILINRYLTDTGFL